MSPHCLQQSIFELHAICQPTAGSFILSDSTTIETRAMSPSTHTFDSSGAKGELFTPANNKQFAQHKPWRGMRVAYHQICLAHHATVVD